MLDQGCAFLSAAGVGAKAASSTLKVHIAAISAHHDPVDGKKAGKHDLVIRFLRGREG